MKEKFLNAEIKFPGASLISICIGKNSLRKVLSGARLIGTGQANEYFFESN